ncbi:TPA: hypothetical protein ACIBU2_001593, partial [Salmonella enterica subsp. enterica serovar Enteritidis]|uniref:hypothetical protein n=1 Tax=Salmonella enterica TaxID=28901 RepID=UPI001955399F
CYLISRVNYILRVMRKEDEKIHCINTNRHDSGIFHPEKAGITVKNELVYNRCKYFHEKFGI